MKNTLRGEEADHSTRDTTFPCSLPQAAQDVKMCHGTILFQTAAFFCPTVKKPVTFKLPAGIQQKHKTANWRFCLYQRQDSTSHLAIGIFFPVRGNGSWLSPLTGLSRSGKTPSHSEANNFNSAVKGRGSRLL